MTAIRQSFVFQLEDEFKAGKSAGRPWLQPPPGSFFDSTETRQTTSMYGAGDKFRQNVAYGQFAGSWNWTFPLDYGYLEPLMLAFESVNGKTFALDKNNGFGLNDNGHFVFKKENTRRVPPFVVRRKISNKMVNEDGLDELDELYGCVVQNISFSRSNSTSQWQVNLSGVFADKKTILGTLEMLDYKAYTPDLVEYACLFQGELLDENYVNFTESLSLSVGNNLAMEWGICSPFGVIYHEDRSQFQFSTTMYAADPLKWKMRAYSGGYDNVHRRPQSKNLRPMETLTVAGYDKSCHDNPSSYPTILSAFQASANSVKVTIKDAAIKSIKYPNGDGSKLVDNISSVECSYLEIDIKTSKASYNLLTTNSIVSDDIESEEEYGGWEYSIDAQHTVYLDRGFAAPVIRYVKIEDTDNETTLANKMNDLKKETLGFYLLDSDTSFNNATDDSETLPLSSILLRPLQEIDGVTVENATDSATSKPYVTISGTATVDSYGYYFIVNPVTGTKGVLRVDAYVPAQTQP